MCCRQSQLLFSLREPGSSASAIPPGATPIPARIPRAGACHPPPASWVASKPEATSMAPGFSALSRKGDLSATPRADMLATGEVNGAITGRGVRNRPLGQGDTVLQPQPAEILARRRDGLAVNVQRDHRCRIQHQGGDAQNPGSRSRGQVRAFPAPPTPRGPPCRCRWLGDSRCRMRHPGPGR